MPEFDVFEQEYFEDRAGILEYVGGWPREKAEALARAETVSFQQARRRAANEREVLT